MADNTTEPAPCTLDTCPASMGQTGYQPNFAGNIILLTAFGILLCAQTFIGIKRKTWSFFVAVAMGLVLEIVGYTARTSLHSDPFSFDAFVQYLVCLTIAPAFLTAAIYVTFTRVVQSCDPSLSFIRPKIVSIIFMVFDFICLVLQAAGGAITATSNGADQDAVDMRQMGVNIMIGGLAFHVVSLFLFISYASVYAWRYRAATARQTARRSQHKSPLRWKLFLAGFTVASIAIFGRCIYRVAELREGFDSDLAHDEVLFMILEGALVLIASICLTVCHPGLCLDIPWSGKARTSQISLESSSFVDLANVHTSK